MRCLDVPEFESLLSGELDEPTAHAARLHIERCSTCRGHFEQVEANLEVLEPVRRAMHAPLDVTPVRVGRFAIIGRLGEGATSIVYLARQERPQRTLAVKLLRADFSTGVTMERFTFEANILARLQHPGIATVFEAGAAEVHTDEGVVGRRPFLAMEYIDGRRIDAYAGNGELTAAQRIELIAQVADAVHHAHLKGVVHRDLKPSNVLVTAPANGDGIGQPKVLDFGVARALEPATWDALSLTGDAAGLIGTLPYMSPEQIENDRDRIDARSDIYSLGVLMFELLTGELPHDVRHTSMVEAARRITDQQPRRIQTVDPQFRGDVDAIVCKALAREPERRYESAAAFAADLRRALVHQPVSARPPSALYQFSRFARRNRMLVVACIIAALALLAGIGAANWYAQQADDARDIAEHRLDDALDASMELVDVIAARMKDNLATYEVRLMLAEEVHEYLSDLHRLHPDHDRVQRSLWVSKRLLSALLRQKGDLQRASTLIDDSFALMRHAYEQNPDDPELRFEYAYSLRYLMAPPESAFDRIRESTAMLVTLHEEDPEDRIYQREAAVSFAALAAYQMGAEQYDEAERSLDRSQRLLEDLRERDAEQPEYSAALVRVALSRSTLFDRLDRPEDAEQHAREALDMAEQFRVAFPEHAQGLQVRVDALMRLSQLAARQDDPKRSLQYVEQALPDAQRLAASDPALSGWQRRLERLEAQRNRAREALRRTPD